VDTAISAIENLLAKSRSEKPALQKDRRRAKRYRMDVPARFRIFLPSQPDHSSGHIPARVVDLSKMGIGLLAETVENGGLHIMHPWTATSEQCHIEVQVLHGKNPLLLQGKAAWYTQLEDKKPFGFRIGIELLDPTGESKESIRELIDSRAMGKNMSPPGAE
jgi:hypothetical protein